jgi:hypothetical protein
VLCPWESPFAGCLSGAPTGDYLSRAIVDGGGAPITDTAFMGLTSCRQITINGDVSTPGDAAGRHHASAVPIGDRGEHERKRAP